MRWDTRPACHIQVKQTATNPVLKCGTGLPSASALIDVVTPRTAWTVNNGQELKLAQGLSVKIE